MSCYFMEQIDALHFRMHDLNIPGVRAPNLLVQQYNRAPAVREIVILRLDEYFAPRVERILAARQNCVDNAVLHLVRPLRKCDALQHRIRIQDQKEQVLPCRRTFLTPVQHQAERPNRWIVPLRAVQEVSEPGDIRNVVGIQVSSVYEYNSAGVQT